MITARDISVLVGGELRGNPDRVITALSTLEQAEAHCVSFLADKKYRSLLDTCKAGLLLVPTNLDIAYVGDTIRVDDPYLAFAQVSAVFDPEPPVAEGVHTSAQIAPSATLGLGVQIGANTVVGPDVVLHDGVCLAANVTLGARTQIGEATIIYPGVTIYHDVRVGKRCRIHAGTVIGSHGFGYANNQGNWHKIAQIGGVVIGDDVEIGANCAIDRGAIEDTRIEQGVKIDNLVHIAHNVTIGAHTALAGQVGISGSTDIGHHTMVGGQSGFAGHIKTAPSSVFTGQSMVTGSVPESGMYSSGTGIMPSKDWRKMVARMRNLDALHRRVQQLEKQLERQAAQPAKDNNDLAD